MTSAFLWNVVDVQLLIHFTSKKGMFDLAHDGKISYSVAFLFLTSYNIVNYIFACRFIFITTVVIRWNPPDHSGDGLKSTEPSPICSEAGSDCPDMDGHFSRVSTPGLLALAIQTAGLVDWDYSRGSDWTLGYTLLSLVFPSVEVAMCCEAHSINC